MYYVFNFAVMVSGNCTVVIEADNPNDAVYLATINEDIVGCGEEVEAFSIDYVSDTLPYGARALDSTSVWVIED